MKRPFESPFAGFPLTKEITDRSAGPGFLVTPVTLTPARARLAELLGHLGGMSATGGMLYGLATISGLSFTDDVLGLGGALVAWGVLKPLLRHYLKAGTAIRLTGDRVSVRGRWGWKHYDRQLPHKFSMVAHDKARSEREQLDLAQRREQLKRQAVGHVRYYGESWHISYDYLGQRNDLLTVYGRKDALAVLARLKACDEVLDSAARTGQGSALSPADEWGDQPGAIPETV
jgi:hypothetical protein